MAGRGFRWLVAGMLVSGGAGLLTLTSTINAGFAYGSDGTALIMGGTFNPLPDPGYVADVNTNYIQPLFPGIHIYRSDDTPAILAAHRPLQPDL